MHRIYEFYHYVRLIDKKPILASTYYLIISYCQMKTTPLKPATLLLLGLGLFLASCHDDYLVVERLPSSSDPNLFMAVYMTNKDFKEGTHVIPHYYQDQSYYFVFDTLTHFDDDWDYLDHEVAPIQNKGLFFDVRNKDGYSTWSQPLLSLTSVNGINLYVDYKPNTTGFDYFFQWSGQLPTPPTYLHLCLNTWDENPTGQVPSKTWKVTKIYDEDNLDLTTDSDWTNYEDNVTTFEKGGRFILELGAKRSQKERELFKNETSVFGTYSVSKNGEIVTLNLVFPIISGNSNDNNSSWMSKLTVVSSSYTSLNLKGELAGKKGTLELVPVN